MVEVTFCYQGGWKADYKAGSKVTEHRALDAADCRLLPRRRFMLEYICAELGLSREQICMVGDRLDTDIVFGLDGGLRTLLVLSGVTTEEMLSASPTTPEFVADTIHALVH